ncbi:hypothetical protein IGI04_003831 [Brassica rapa subsp. trilocularis]|uniref:Uncharacterized protein n=1 Tax=Brassica rapa subsp. trilocularis TaxID=1813537 RepID=A0ABQ7P319_BRACM|nr:hypothetical protein IGI04_003831 [Brassica rapa subsp. trilocularis]
MRVTTNFSPLEQRKSKAKRSCFSNRVPIKTINLKPAKMKLIETWKTRRSRDHQTQESPGDKRHLRHKRTLEAKPRSDEYTGAAGVSSEPKANGITKKKNPPSKT